jgi:hypothetical protein
MKELGKDMKILRAVSDPDEVQAGYLPKTIQECQLA